MMRPSGDGPALEGRPSASRTLAVIPARFASTRLPGKMLADLGGKPLIVRTWEAARRVASLDDVLVATDDERILAAVEKAGGKAVLTDPALPSGSDRVWAAARETDADVLVNIQGDEPLMPPEVINSAVQLLLAREDFDVTTAASPLQAGELENPDVVKLVRGLDGSALYFSRAAIPHLRDGTTLGPNLAWRHIGLYVYRREALERFCDWEPTPLELCEKLEQLRMLEHGLRIGVAEVQCDSIGVDTQRDLERVRSRFER